MRAARIRLAEPGDVPGIAACYVASWRAIYRGILPRDYLDALDAEHQERVWLRVLARAPQEHAFVAEHLGRIVGLASGGASRRAGQRREAEIYTLYLRPGATGHGLGRRLVAHAAEQLLADGYRSLRIIALKANPARDFYRRLGGRAGPAGWTREGGRRLALIAYDWPDLAAAEAGFAGLDAIALPPYLQRSSLA